MNQTFISKKNNFKNLLLEPYRLFFFTGTLYAILSIGFWFGWYYQLFHSHPSNLQFNFAPTQIHSHLMMFGVIGFYVFGFALTAFPRFVNQEQPSSPWVFTLWALLSLSQLFLILGTFENARWISLAAPIEMGSYLLLAGTLLKYFLKNGNYAENKQPLFVLISLVAAITSITLFYLYLFFPNHPEFYKTSLQGGTYLFLLFLITSITYRVVPFFTSRVISNYKIQRSNHFLTGLFILLLLRFIVFILCAQNPYQNYVLWSLDILLWILLFQEWRKWLHPKIFKIPLVWVLYLSLGWILLSLSFSFLEIIFHLMKGLPASQAYFQLPAFHALFIGCFATLILGISTRVTKGHGGFPLLGDRWMLGAIILIQIAALWRVIIPTLEAFGFHSLPQAYWAGIFWVLAFAVWGIRYLPLLLLPKK